MSKLTPLSDGCSRRENDFWSGDDVSFQWSFLHPDLKSYNFLFANKKEKSVLKAIDLGFFMFFKSCKDYIFGILVFILWICCLCKKNSFVERDKFT